MISERKQGMTYFAKTTDELVSWEAEHQKMARKIAAEGMVLLENNGVLPLSKKVHTIALYGNGARKTIKGGTGSGDVNSRYSVSVEEGLENAGYQVLTKEWLNRYDEIVRDDFAQWKRELQCESEEKNKMFVLCYLETPHRIPTQKVEKKDLVNADLAVYVIARRSGEGSDRSAQAGDYYLYPEETEALSLLGETYENTVVVLNTGGVVDTSFFKKIKGLSAMIVMSQAGMEGGNALCDILTGAVTPSGRLADSYASDYKNYPSSDNFSYYAANAMEVVYEEESFVGYRKFGPRNQQVNYSFGYGLSYTEFLINVTAVKHDPEEECTDIQVKITNSGQTFKGKEVLQLYISKKIEDIETAERELIAFQKSEELELQASEEIKFSISWKELAVYDENIGSWVLKEGTYTFYLGDNLDSAVDVAKIEINEDRVYPLIRAGQEEITEETFPLMEEEMLSLVVGLAGKPEVEMVGNASIRVPGAAGETSGFGEIPSMVLADGGSGLRLQHIFHTDAQGCIIDNDVMSSLERGAFSVAMEQTEGKKYYQYCTAWPITTLLAQTWNRELLFELGKAVSKEMQEYGAHIWLAPAMNIHRNPLCGRNFEYFSEDPVLTGKLAAGICQGVQDSGRTGVTIKHFAANNQELYRMEMNSIVSERTLRELYLKAFEIVVREAEPVAIMTSYNKLNGKYTANNEWLCNKIAREEWGYQGIIMTDWGAAEGGKAEPWKCIEVGNDLIMPGCREDKENIREALKMKKLSITKLRECAYRISRVARRLS